ncbi:hypothetical protein [Aromatoleum toluclasticum]|uniref:hypothetical protein n=1 Tax=Aromatoleum toluclasticum TaxID=92003 RepID=UPI00036200E5|nr:hypothetical protein [Aromatoleum toluclasticum]
MRPALPALEKNILKYRALQMVLLLHQVESLRTFVIGSIRATDRLASATGGRGGRLPLNAKRPMEKALAILVQEDVITEKESIDLQQIIDVRNKIGHKVHELVEGISAPKVLGRSDPIYDYFALDRFERYRKKISSRMQKSFVLELSFRELSFEQAEGTYKEELARLRNRIDRQFEVRRAAA